MTEPDSEPHVDDFEDPEEFAEAVGVDPTAEQVDEYLAETGQAHDPDRAEEAAEAAQDQRS